MPDEQTSTPPASSSPSSPSPSAVPPAATQRPGGITILSILYGLYGALFLFGGLALVAFGSLIAHGLGRFFFPMMFAGIIDVIGFFLILIGIIVFIITWGLWNLKEWAWLVAVVFAVLGLLYFPIGTLINLFILWYLFKPEVKAAFKQG